MSSDRANVESASKETGPGLFELQELEEELCRLGGVLAVRVVGDRIGRPIEVHVLADNSKPPKQTVHDVRSVAQTVFGLELDHRIVSVAQFDTSETDEPVHIRSGPKAPCSCRSGCPVRQPKARLRRLRSCSGGRREQSGYSGRLGRCVGRPQLVASATLDALRQLEPRPTPCTSRPPTSPDRQEPDRCGDRRLGRATARAADVGLGGRAPRPRRRRSEGAPRRGQPPNLPSGGRTALMP